MAMTKSGGVPDKKDRNCEVIRTIAPKNDIVRISKPSVIKTLVEAQVLPPYLTLRRSTSTFLIMKMQLYISRHVV